MVAMEPWNDGTMARDGDDGRGMMIEPAGSLRWRGYDRGMAIGLQEQRYKAEVMARARRWHHENSGTGSGLRDCGMGVRGCNSGGQWRERKESSGVGRNGRGEAGSRGGTRCWEWRLVHGGASTAWGP